MCYFTAIVLEQEKFSGDAIKPEAKNAAHWFRNAYAKFSILCNIRTGQLRIAILEKCIILTM